MQKYQRSIGGRKKSARAAGLCGGASVSNQAESAIPYRPLIIFQPLDLQECTVPHLKDLINTCLENESQGHGMTFNMIYDRSKYPHFISYRGLC